jgi:homoserine kinase type II
MSVFTTVTREQLDTWLKHYSVGTVGALEGIAAGIENTNYFVTTSQGRFVLTLFEKLTTRELPFYLNLMDHLARHGVPSARPVPDRSGNFLRELNGKPAALVSFLPGQDVASPAPGHCAQAGAMLADIHLAGSSYPGRMDNPRGPQWWRKAMPEIAPFLGAGDLKLLEDEVRFHSVERFLDLPQGAIHADLFRDNVLFDNGRVSGVIDFYFACTGAWLYDVAITVNDWCVTANGALDEARAAAMLGAYGQKRPFTEAERGAWPAMLRAGALRFWVSRLYDFYLPRPGELTHAKDPGHFRNILAARIAAGERLRLAP